MALSFATTKEIRDEWFRVDVYANRVRTAIDDRFRSVDSDRDLDSLADYVQALKSFLERLFTEAFDEDGKAMLDGTHARYNELTELIEQLLNGHDSAWLPPRVAELDEIVSRGTAILKDAPIVPVDDDHRLAAELREILEGERQGRFVSMYFEYCEPEDDHCREFQAWERRVERLRRNLDRQDPEGADRRQQARSAATRRTYEAELEYLENRRW